MRIGNADGAGDDAHAEEEADLLPPAKVGGVGGVPDQGEQQGGLDGKPDQRDQAIPKQIGVGGLRIGVVAGLADDCVEQRKQAPSADGGQQHGKAAEIRANEAERNHAEGGPERQGVCHIGGGWLHVRPFGS